MSGQPVEMVWVFQYSKSHFKALYGRRVQDAANHGYTKDYLQISGDCKQAFEDIVGREIVSGHEEQFVYKWPGGEMPGQKLLNPNDRLHLRWPTSDSAPAPWRMAQSINSESLETFEGNAELETAQEADLEWERFETSNQDPWLLIVKLKDEPRTLHLRAYLGNPPSHLKHCGTAQLPSDIRECMDEVTASSRRACGVVSYVDQERIEPSLHSLLTTLKTNPNVLLVGPPGTGKTVLLEKLTKLVEEGVSQLWFDSNLNHNAFVDEYSALGGKTRTVVLHPSYSYENLVLGLLPSARDGHIAVKVSTGPLVNLAHYASESRATGLLVLDEFNRGNAAAILGDSLALLDSDKRSDIASGREGAVVDLPYSDMDIQVPEEFAPNGNRNVSSRFSLPKSLWIVAAMNSSDRSVAPLDAAMRRRFAIVNVMPDYEALRSQIGATESELPVENTDWEVNDVLNLSVLLLKRLNKRIESIIGPDFMLGQSQFWHVAGHEVDNVLASLSRAMDEGVVPTLQMMFTDYDEALATILKADSSENASTSPVYNSLCYWSRPDEDLGAVGYPRLRFNLLSTMNSDNALHELKRLTGV